ncbi:MAG: hypothetical protein ACRDTN_01750, partial [Mycobacterium sp.]
MPRACERRGVAIIDRWGSTVDCVSTAPVTAAARGQPDRQGASSALRRLLPYLRPYRARWITMLVVAVISLAATVAIPLMTKAVIDGPVQH